MIRTLRMIAVFLSVIASAVTAANAGEPRFHPAPGAMPVIGRYVVTLADSVADDLIESSVKGLAMTYSAQLEPQHSPNVRQFTVTMAPARARTLSADPRVREVVEIPQSDQAGSAASAAPSHADLSRHGLFPVAQDVCSSGTYLYDGAGNIKAIGSDTFVYDVVGRLKQAIVQGSQQNYTYDAFGNRILTTRETNAVGCVGGCEAPSTAFGQSNHLTGATYDDAGNVISVSGAVYAYDGTGMVTRTTVGSDDRMFIYTADDERIGVRNGLSWTWTVRDQGNKVLREFTSRETQSSPLVLDLHTWTKDYVWRDGLLLASVSQGTSGPMTYHYHLDHLGTPRMITNDAGVLVAKHTYYSFGADMDITPHESAVEAMKFTGHERDTVAGSNASVDYMHARFYNANLGRFLSVDKGAAQGDEPQTWNRYVYAGNNPMMYLDPDGHNKKIYLVQSFDFRSATYDFGAERKAASASGYELKVTFFGSQTDMLSTLAKADNTDFVMIYAHMGGNGPAEAQVFGSPNDKADLGDRFVAGPTGYSLPGSTLASAINWGAENGKPAGVVLAGCNSAIPAKQITAQTGVPTLGTTGNLTFGQHAATLATIISAITKAGTINTNVANEVNTVLRTVKDAPGTYGAFGVPK